MFVVVLALFVTLAAAGASQTAPNPPLQKCQANADGKKAWLDHQGLENDYFPGYPDTWGWSSNQVPLRVNDLFYFTLVDYLCNASPDDMHCDRRVETLTQSCYADYIDIKVVLRVENANTWIGWLKTLAPMPDFDSTWPPAPLYGCRLDNTTKEPAVKPASPNLKSICGGDNWRSWLASSSGRFEFTYRIKVNENATCTCDDATNTKNYALDATHLDYYNNPEKGLYKGVDAVMTDNDVSFTGTGYFNEGSKQLPGAPAAGFAGVPGTHTIGQTFAGPLVDCTGPDGIQCFQATKGRMVLKIDTSNGALSRLLQPLNNINPSYAAGGGHKKSAKAPLRQQALKK